MKRKDIKAGVVYTEVRAYGIPSPLVFLEDGAATVWLEPYNNLRRGDPYIACRPAEKPHRERGRSGRSQGYATVWGSAEALEGLDCAAELEAFKAGGQPTREGLRFVLLFSLARISGPYAEAVAAHEAAIAADRAARDHAAAEAEAREDRAASIVAALAEAGVKAHAHDGRIWLSLDQAGRVVDLLRDRNQDAATAASGEDAR
jgi:hypothetical protein